MRKAEFLKKHREGQIRSLTTHIKTELKKKMREKAFNHIMEGEPADPAIAGVGPCSGYLKRYALLSAERPDMNEFYKKAWEDSFPRHVENGAHGTVTIVPGHWPMTPPDFGEFKNLPDDKK